MSRRTFDEWLTELRVIVSQNLEKKLEDIPEFDVSDARSYFRGKDAPIVYFSECLCEDQDGPLDEVALGKIMNERTIA